MKFFLPCHSDDLIVATRHRARLRRLAIRVAGRQRAGLWSRLARARRRAAHFTHVLTGPLPAPRDTFRRAARRAELTPTSQAVLSATDRLLDACGAPGRVPSANTLPSNTT